MNVDKTSKQAKGFPADINPKRGKELDMWFSNTDRARLPFLPLILAIAPSFSNSLTYQFIVPNELMLSPFIISTNVGGLLFKLVKFFM